MVYCRSFAALQVEPNPYDLSLPALRAKLLADAVRKEKTALPQPRRTKLNSAREIGVPKQTDVPSVIISRELAMQSTLYSRDYAWGQEKNGELLVYDEELDDWATAKVLAS